MKDLNQWVCWRSEKRDGKLTKVPYSPRSGLRARSDNPDSWGTLVEAEQAAERDDYDGIGFVFAARDPFCGVDLDSCVDPEMGEIEPWASEIVEGLDSYTEFSPSGRGLHIMVQAKLPPGGNRKDRIELYDRGRFFTVTMRRLPGTSRRIEDRQEEVDALHARLFLPEEQQAPAKPATHDSAKAGGLADAEVLRRAMSSRSGVRFAKLWAGDRSGYASDSEADLALCSMLAFWVGPDEERIASLFARSGLDREKWNREDYRQRTISRALAGTADFYARGSNGLGLSRNGHLPDPEAAGFPSNVLGHISPLPEAAEFPVEVMPAPCRRLVEEATASLGCAPELVALPMLAALSSAIGASRVVEVKGGWREGATLFLAVVASPGAMKTPAAKVAKKRVFERQRELGRVYAEDREDWKRELREWEVDKRKAAKAGEIAPEQPEAPSMDRCVASDTTIEALVSILEANPRGLLIHKDELTGWVRSMDQYKGGKGSDRQHWLSLWSNDEVVVDRKSRQGEPVVLAKPFVSLFGGIQPTMLGELGGGMEDGLMDRFLFAYPAPRHVRFNDHEIGAEAEAEYAALYRRLSGLLLVTDEHGDPNPKPLKLSPEATRLFAETIDVLGAEVLEPGFPRRLEGVWSKLRGYLARLSLVLAVCRCVGRSPGGDQHERVEVEDVEAAAKLLGYFKAHARRVYAELRSPDPLETLGADLKKLIEEAGGRLEATATELYRKLEEADCEALPARPKELSQSVRALADRSSALRTSFGHRGKERVIRLELLENSVGSVGKDPARTDVTDATDARSGDRRVPDDRRSRFTL
jgi:putative DNA primase/helicase